MRPKRTEIATFTLAIALILIAVFCVPAHSYTLGAADGNPAAAPFAKTLGAKTYRVVMDPSIPLDAYAPRIEAFRALGMRPQITVGGAGTTIRGKTTSQRTRIVHYALAALRRWPDTYSISAVNEPDLSGISACGYTSTHARLYKAVKRSKALRKHRVLFGEFSPHSPLQWTSAAINKCAKRGIVVADGWAWHCYDIDSDWVGLQNGRDIYAHLRSWRRHLHTRGGKTLPMYCTEYGVPTRSSGNMGEVSDTKSVSRWKNALRIAKGNRRWPGVRQLVIWGITESGRGSKWDTSLVAADGRIRPAFWAIANDRRH